MDSKTLKKELEELGKKYNLPIKELDKELEISDLFLKRKEMPDFPIRAIRRKLVDNYLLWINYLHSFTFPSSHSIVIAKEADGFNEKEKNEMYRIISHLAKATRESVIFEIKRDETKEADFVRENFENLKKIKKEIEKFAEKTIEFWKKESEKKDNE